MSDTVKIRVPFFVDDPIAGRIISPLPLGIITDSIQIENGELTYIFSKLASKKRKSFHLKNIRKILVIKKYVSCWTNDHKLDPYGRTGTEIELLLVDSDGEKHPLIPKFLLNQGQKQWDKFFHKLCKFSGLPLDETNVRSRKE